MLRHYLLPSLTLTALILAGACSPREAAERSAAADTASGNGGGGARKIGELGNLEAPEAAKYDADQDVWFVANVNGTVVAKDNNGYISRLTPDGKMETQKFIAGGVKGVTLNAPKGMAITGDTLWVADFDVVRAFNRRTGAALATVPVKGAKFLNDLTAGPDGIYATDTGVLAGEKGFSHPGPDRVYKISGGKASVALESPGLSGPNGITWNRDHFVIVPFMGTEIMSWKPGEKDVKVIATGPGQQDGVEVLSDGRLLSNSWTDSSLFVIDNGKVTKVASGIPTPADHAYDGKSKVLVPLLMENRVELWELR